jgi:multiple sugar transport system permease protein
MAPPISGAATAEPRAIAGSSRRLAWRRLGLWLGVALVVAYCLAPTYWMLVSSLKSANAIFNNRLLPADPTLENYRAVFGAQNKFGHALRNSLIIASTVTMVAMGLGVLAAYALVRLRFRGKLLVLAGILATSMFPGAVIVTPLFQLFSNLGWIDRYQSMIIPDIGFALPLGIWILASFLAEIPWELEQAAQVDGCTPGQAFRKVMLPLAAPGVFTAAILVFIRTWNEYLVASVMSQTLASQPVTVAIAKFTGVSQFQQPFGTQMAAGVVLTVPLVVVVLLFQRRIVAGLTAGGLKG